MTGKTDGDIDALFRQATTRWQRVRGLPQADLHFEVQLVVHAGGRRAEARRSEPTGRTRGEVLTGPWPSGPTSFTGVAPLPEWSTNLNRGLTRPAIPA